jgi:FixJ family two-component response regulator
VNVVPQFGAGLVVGSVFIVPASGLTNRQVAAALYISPKTVESSLARVYPRADYRESCARGSPP